MSTPALASRIPLPLLIGTGAVVFLANAGLLVLQLVGGRFLAPFIGSSVETWTSVIGVFLTGIALGNWLGGRLADRFPTPRTVSVLLVLSGLSALGMIACYEFTLSSGFYKSIPLGPRIPLLALMFCLPPALLLSLLTPLTIKLILPDVGSAGRIAGLIFALSTLGCLIGNYFTGFWLMAEFTLNEITRGVGVGLVALSIPVFFIRRENVAQEARATARAPETESGPADGGWDFRGNIGLAYTVVFIASFCGMSLELTGARVLAPILGVSLFSWTGIIGVMLAGTCCGNYLGGVLADRGVGPALVRFAFLIAFLVGAAVAPLVARHTVEEFNPERKEWVEYSVRLLGAALGCLAVLPGLWLARSGQGRIAVFAVVGGLIGIVLAHTACRAIDQPFQGRLFGDLMARPGGSWAVHGLGFITGAAIALLFVWDAPKGGERTTRSGALSGTLLAGGLATVAILLLFGVYQHYTFMKTPGDIIDKVLAWTFGLFFLPMLLLGMVSPQVIRLSVPDVASAGRVAGSVYAWSTGGAIAGTFVAGYFLISAVGTFRVLMVLAFALTALAFLVGRLWKHNAMLYAASIATGAALIVIMVVNYRPLRYDLETKYYAIRVDTEVIRGEEVHILVLDRLWHSIIWPGEPTRLYYTHEYVQGELLVAARDKPGETNLLVIGGGGYTFPRYVELLMPDVHTDVVEIDPGVTEIAHLKLGLPRDTRIVTHNMDGRQFVAERAPKGHYKLVMQDAVNDLSVPYHLMTREYNDAVKATLTPGGGYLLTLIDSLEKGLLWRAAVHTMRQTFKHVYVLGSDDFRDADGKVSAAQSVYIVYGSDEPLDLEKVKASVEQWRRQKLAGVSAAAAVGAPAGALAQPTLVTDLLAADHNTMIHVLDAETLQELLDKHKTIVLTDQYCPVDNLMSEVFRRRERGR
jgi:spermidine synthase